MSKRCFKCGVDIETGVYCREHDTGLLVGNLASACKVEAIEACIETVESRIATAKACRYDTRYIAGMEDILIFHRATLERVKRGEGYHSTSDLMSEPIRGVPKDICALDEVQDMLEKK
jgi:hypothetical protein